MIARASLRQQKILAIHRHAFGIAMRAAMKKFFAPLRVRLSRLANLLSMRGGILSG
jgi:hypothetical protein